MRKLASRPWFWVALALLGLVVWLFIWPVEEVRTWRLVPSEAFLVASFDLSDPGASEVATRFLTARGLPKLAVPLLMPGRLTFSYGPDSKLLIADMGRKVRLARLLLGLSRWPHRALGGSILLAERRSYLDEAVGQYRSRSSRWMRTEVIVRGFEGRDGFFVVDNREGHLSGFVRRMEERFEFSAFPSVDDVTMIVGYIELEGGMGRGRVSFFCRDGKVEGLKSDVRYIYGMARRKLRAYGLELRGRVGTEPGVVGLEFELEGVPEAVARVLSRT
ncbi:MAG TPA: hypothetical protein EYP61_10045 [Candidatus Latescibacteria bacterium]|nr:hypothetical protein [Candidatus Latescibacterota bacterium]